MKTYIKRAYYALAALTCGIGIAYAVAPPANSVIGNQATASFTDSTGAIRSATSNLVQTTVAQVNAFTLTASQTKTVAPGGTVYFPHTITNTGNGPDTYSLLAADGTVNGVTSVLCTQGTPAAPQSATGGSCNVFIYPDADGNGIPDSNVFLTGTATGTAPTAAVAANGTFKFVVAMQWPAGVTAGTETLAVSATSLSSVAGSIPPTTPTLSNTDTINVTSLAVINVTKALSKSTGNRSTAACPANPGTVAAPVAGCENLTVTLTYTNTGGATAGVTITDLLNSGATSGLRYIPSSGRWSGCASTVLTDAGGAGAEAAPCANIAYDFGTTANTVSAVIANVTPGQSGTLTFEVNVASTAPTGTAGTTNTANYVFTGGLPADATTPKPTNPASYSVNSAAGVVANNKTTASTNVAGIVDNEVLITNAPQGGSVWFRNVIWNTGSDLDSYDITTFSSSFPAGTAIAHYSDTTAGTGVSGSTPPLGLGSPLTDSTGNGVIDTGPIAAGGFKVVWTKVDLQPNTTVDAPGFNLVLRATSKNDPALFDDTTDRLDNITERTVDLANGAAVGPAIVVGTGATVQAGVAAAPAAVTTNTDVAPGGKTRFNLTVLPSAADNYDLTAWNTWGASGVSTSAFGTGASVGYSVAFFPGACPAAGVAISAASITNTGTITNTTTATPFCAEVSVPATATVATLDIFFRTLSPATGKMTAPFASWDVKRDALTIKATSTVTITPDRTGTTFPGGNVVYAHQVCNVGNSAATVAIASSNSNTAAGFTSATWVDADNSGTITPASAPPDTPLASGANISVPANTCISVLNNVFAPAGASNGVSNATTITASVGGAPVGSVNDTTTVVVSDVGLVKEQREVTCTGGGAGTAVAGVNGPWTQSTMAGKVLPGACIQYRITATNSGSAGVTGLTLSDTTPNFTFFNSVACAATGNTGSVAAPVTAPATGAVGNVSTAAVSLPALGTVQLVFCVKVDD